MIKRYFKTDILNTIFITLVMLIFVLAVYLSKLNYTNDDNLFNEFNTLPLYFKMIFYTLIPLFKNFRYLFIYSNIYLLIVIIIYYIYILNKINMNNAIELTHMSNKEFIIKYMMSKLLNITIIITTIYTTYSILSLAIYKNFDVFIVYGFLINLAIITVISIVFYVLAINNIKLFSKRNKAVS